MKETDIRPQDLFNRFLELSRSDIDTFFSNNASFEPARCPACNTQDAQDGMVKYGFQYLVCSKCRSLYCSPRPQRAQLEDFYQQSEAVEFWANQVYVKTADARRRTMFVPRAQLALDITMDRKDARVSPVLVDIGSGHAMFLEEARRLGSFGDIIGVEPNNEFAALCRKRGFPVINKCAEDLQPEDVQADVATCFEVLEHVYDPRQFLLSIREILARGGKLLLTTLAASGFDIQVLWEDSKSVSPPHHLNLLSVDGIQCLFERSGYRVLKLETPGELDLDIVANAYRENDGIKRSRFVEQLVLHDDDETKHAFQRFLVQHRLSSHIRVVAERVD
jgi:SAM-dependent methyltransferase